MLHEVQLIILRFDDEVGTIDLNRTGRASTKRRICQHHLSQILRFLQERVFALDRTAVHPDAMQIHVHRSHGDNERRNVAAVKRIISQESLELFVQRLILHVRKG